MASLFPYHGKRIRRKGNKHMKELVRELEAKKQEQLRHRMELKEQRDKTIARKARTHRLIVRGAIAEHAMDYDEDTAAGMSNEEFGKRLYYALHRQNAVTVPVEKAHGSDPR